MQQNNKTKNKLPLGFTYEPQDPISVPLQFPIQTSKGIEMVEIFLDFNMCNIKEQHFKQYKQDVMKNAKCCNDKCKNISTKSCHVCKYARYCSRSCQKVDWKEHKANCSTTIIR
jgi:hypothetical protein